MSIYGFNLISYPLKVHGVITREYVHHTGKQRVIENRDKQTHTQRVGIDSHKD